MSVPFRRLSRVFNERLNVGRKVESVLREMLAEMDARNGREFQKNNSVYNFSLVSNESVNAKRRK